jgi:hypothetical protein
MDWNPLNSSLFTGAGTPWGAPQQKGADFSGISYDPMAYSGFDSSALAKAMRRRMMEQGARTQAQATAGLNKAGIKGADTSRALTDLAAQQEQGLGDIEAQTALQDYNTRMANRDAAMKMEMFKQSLNAQRQAAEEASRSSFWGNLMNVGGAIGGAYLGNKWGQSDPNAFQKPKYQGTYGPWKP